MIKGKKTGNKYQKANIKRAFFCDIFITNEKMLNLC